MKRNLNAAEKSAFRPPIPATFTQPEPEVHQALAGPAADALIEPPATEHAPMAFPGPYAHVERNAPRHFALAMQRELDAPTLIAALRTWIGGAAAAEAYHQLFQIQCDQFRQYCEQLGSAV